MADDDDNDSMDLDGDTPAPVARVRRSRSRAAGSGEEIKELERIADSAVPPLVAAAAKERLEVLRAGADDDAEAQRHALEDMIEEVRPFDNTPFVETFPELAGQHLVQTSAPFERFKTVFPTATRAEKEQLWDYLRYRYVMVARTTMHTFLFGICTAPASASMAERCNKAHFVPIDQRRLSPLVQKSMRRLKLGPLAAVTGAKQDQLETYPSKIRAELRVPGDLETYRFPPFDPRFFLQRILTEQRKKAVAPAPAALAAAGDDEDQEDAMDIDTVQPEPVPDLPPDWAKYYAFIANSYEFLKASGRGGRFELK